MVKKTHGETIHYVFQGTEPIYTKNVTTGKVKSYVYAGSKLISRVDGVIGDTTAKKYWYHTDQVGSVKAVTNQAGAVVWNADYLPFGTQYTKNKIDPEFEEDDLGFTGKGYDSDVGLYYFNARWYDAELGRFISEDPVGDPNNPNLYSYCANNPLSFNDLTGCYVTEDGTELVGPPERSDSNPPKGGPTPAPAPAPPGPKATPTPGKSEGPILNSNTNGDNNQTVTVSKDANGNTIITVTTATGEGKYGYITGLNAVGDDENNQVGSNGAKAIAGMGLFATIVSLFAQPVSVESTTVVTVTITPSGEISTKAEVYTSTIDCWSGTELDGGVTTYTKINISIVDNSTGKKISSATEYYAQESTREQESLVCEREAETKGKLTQDSNSWTVNVNVKLNSDIDPGAVISKGGWNNGTNGVSISISNNNGSISTNNGPINISAPQKN